MLCPLACKRRGFHRIGGQDRLVYENTMSVPPVAPHSIVISRRRISLPAVDICLIERNRDGQPSETIFDISRCQGVDHCCRSFLSPRQFPRIPGATGRRAAYGPHFPPFCRTQESSALQQCGALFAIDAVDGAHSAASKCHRVVALEQTTLRGSSMGEVSTIGLDIAKSVFLSLIHI